MLDAQELHHTQTIFATFLILLRDATALIAIPLLIFYLFSYLVIVSIRKSGLNRSYLSLIKKGDIASITLNKFISANDREKGVYFLDKPDKGLNEFEFANNKELGKISGILNYKAFRNSPWQDSENDKIDRNISHIMKNDKCILLMKNKDGDYIGFTHIIPVNQEIWNEYLSGAISDNDFSCENIVPAEKEFDDDKATGVIVFSIALLSDADQVSASDRLQYVFEAIHYHLYEMVQKEFKRNRHMNVLVQTSENKLARLCQNSGMKKHHALSKDNCPMYLGKIRIK